MQLAPDAVRLSIAEQIAPLLALHHVIAEERTPVVDTLVACERVRRGLPALDAVAVVSSVSGLDVAYVRATVALERAGLARNADAARAREWRDRAPALAAEWLAGECLADDRVKRVALRAAGVVAAAVLRRAAELVIPLIDVGAWERPVCPCCGGAPDIALPERDARALVCSRCNARWSTHEQGCLGCGAQAEPTIGRIEAEALGYALTICHSCGRYLKERAEPSTFDPVVERVLTAELDLVAERRGLRL